MKIVVTFDVSTSTLSGGDRVRLLSCAATAAGEHLDGQLDGTSLWLALVGVELVDR